MNYFASHRFTFMLASTFLTVVSAALALVAWYGSSEDKGAVMSCAWTVMEYDDINLNVYFGTTR